ncbi:MAG TPA: hypothetical protein PKY70_08085 [Nakamurella multipartita]|nr:hypothetical protein [Nakamurella multipartita]
MANRVWKWVGLAGLAGVAATGVIVARDQRERRAYEPDDVRARLHERAAARSADPAADPAQDPAAEPAAGSESAAAPHGTGARRWWWPWRRWHRVTPDESAPPA